MTTGVAFEQLLRDLAPRVLATLIRRYRDFADAEDALQEALAAASAEWPKTGVPDHPRAWLAQVAARRLTDRIRSDSARRKREAQVAREARAPQARQDDSLILLFLCCHPALTLPSAIALTLRAAGGLTTAEIARAFLVPDATMAQRISRAKQTIKESGIPFRLPDRREQGERLRAVLHVLYLIFNEGYTATAGDQLQRSDLAAEAIRLCRMLAALLPGDGEVAGLLALMLLTDARRAARTGPHGEAIPLDRQDRGLWDRAQIAEGVDLLTRALAKAAAGPYQVQAAIAAVHDQARNAQETDWPQILALYRLLYRMTPSPMVLLNQAVAAAMVHGAPAGLDLLRSIEADGGLLGHYRLDAVRGHLLEMAGDTQGAIASYRIAAARTASLPERNYLLEQAAQLASSCH